ncbi:MAG: hypothetical protein ACK4OO_04095, partial [bacterium]
MKPRKLLNRAVLVLVVIGISLYYLYPTIRYHRTKAWVERQAASIALEVGASYPFVIEGLNREEPILLDFLNTRTQLAEEERKRLEVKIEEVQKVVQNQLAKYRKKAIKQGLDLQGGMHLVLEVDLVQLLRNMARQRDPKLESILSQIRTELDQNPQTDFNEVVSRHFRAAGERLSRYFGEPGESDETILNTISKQADDAVDRSLEIIRNRIDQFGVSEPTIAKQGSRRIILELPGIQDPNRARDIIGRTALLEFKLLLDNDKIDAILKDIDKALSEKPVSDSQIDREVGSTSSDTVVNLMEEMEEGRKSAEV